MISLISIIIFGTYGGYNRWMFEQDIRKHLNIPFTKPTLYNYYCQLLKAKSYKMLNCFVKNKSYFQN